MEGSKTTLVFVVIVLVVVMVVVVVVMEVVVVLELVVTEVMLEVPKVSEHWLHAWGTAVKGLRRRDELELAS